MGFEEQLGFGWEGVGFRWEKGKEGHSKKGKSEGAEAGPCKENVGRTHVGEKEEEEGGRGQLLRASNASGGNSVCCVDTSTQ